MFLCEEAHGTGLFFVFLLVLFCFPQVLLSVVVLVYLFFLKQMAD